MQGKGAGAVNRVELECQVLCAALRGSWIRQDKVGAFTSIRELSHLFPDLLPPPEERNGSNKANYYEVLTVRPQAGLNSIVVGYLRTVRKFLKEYNPKDYRPFYNTVLNAGFVLRKPRLRLSHDLVVARRWLFESQMEDDIEAAPAEEEEDTFPEALGAHSTEPIRSAAESMEPAPSLTVDPSVLPKHLQPQEKPLQPPPLPPGADTENVPKVESDSDDDYDPIGDIQKAWEMARAQKTPSFELPSTAPLEQAPAPPPAVSEPERPSPLAESPKATPASAVSPEAPTSAAPGPAPSHSAPSHSSAPPAAQAHSSEAPAHGFHFDEKQLHKAEADIDLPSVIRLMEASRLITKVEVQALKAQMQLAPNVSAAQLCLNAGYATKQELDSLKLAEDLLSRGKITMAQFQVAMYDERMSGLRMAESLQVRGWLETEVKNVIEEFKQNEA